MATEIYFSHRNQLIFIYHETLKLILEKLSYKGKVPTLNELQVELLRKGALGEWCAFSNKLGQLTCNTYFFQR